MAISNSFCSFFVSVRSSRLVEESYKYFSKCEFVNFVERNTSKNVAA